MTENASRRPAERSGANELMSCLMDGELGPAERGRGLDRLCSDERARSDWALWHAVGDALRSPEVAALHSEGFAARLAGRIAAEPAIVAPRAQGADAGLVRRLALPAAASAAAVAVLAVVALPVLRDDGRTQVDVARVPQTAQPAGPLPRAPVYPAMPFADSFDVYLTAHGQMSGPLGMPRTSQYLRQGVVEPDFQR